MHDLLRYGQSAWLEYIRRSLMDSGELAELIAAGLRGLTSNPSIFAKAIAGSDEYDAELRALLERDPHATGEALFEALAVSDIGRAADLFRGVYEETNGADGFVSIEVSPRLAADTASTLAEARRLWRTLARPNVMIKVPATPAGIPAIERLIAEGINVNVTLMFSLRHYDDVAAAYLRGLQACTDPSRVASVASFFVSRIDSAVDPLLDSRGGAAAAALRGRIAIANAKRAYARYREIFGGPEFAPLRARGARAQRVLFASTSTKDPRYPDMHYVEALIGPDTVDTLPPDTLVALLDHGRADTALEQDLEGAARDLEALAELDIDFNEVTRELQDDGVRKFVDSFDELLASILEKGEALRVGECGPEHAGHAGRAEYALVRSGAAVDKRLREWTESGFGHRLWRHDATLWSAQPVPELTDRLGWLRLPELLSERVDELEDLAADVKYEGIRDVVLLGMGGSSLAPEVFQRTLGNAAGYPRLRVLDSTHPAAVRAVERAVDLTTTLFVVSSKSGTTTETLSFFRYFWARLAERVKQPGRHFIAITDPGTPLAELAAERGFRAACLAPPDVGGRYSALAEFGLVPAALIGADVRGLLDQAWCMAEAAAFCVPETHNPGLLLGASLGELARTGRNKLTFLTSPALNAFPDWIEQLIAESTGKDGRGIVPVVGEAHAMPDAYGDDRFFVHLALADEAAGALDEAVAKLEAAGHPVARFHLPEPLALGAEMFRWELAVAAAGSVLGIHPFNQPDVQLAKDMARQAMAGAGAGVSGGVAVKDAAGLGKAFERWLAGAEPGGYIALQAFVEPSDKIAAALAGIRARLRERTRLATTVGFGPRFLHSTGQLHKGGPEGGIFLQLVDEPAEDLEIPETDHSFGRLLRAQADGDYAALAQRGRGPLRLELGRDPLAALARIEAALGG
ncbi:MAG: bifunctional transaldolase/phosoglucose isomerase [Gemmatimonadetes bacterium]|nr:bifunctional transaldolase/phosoglucose isomerase [Gemmatimonadota bacterium]